jgi:peptide/nickel transport system substrate-binding protein
MNKPDWRIAIRIRNYLAGVVVLTLLLAACGGAPPETPATDAPAEPATAAPEAPATEAPATEAPTEPATAAPEAPATEAPAEADGDPQGTFRFGYFSRFLTWDPHQESRPITLMGYQMVYDALLSEDLDGSLLPGLATEWEQTADSIELTLREGVVFHDGTPFDAEAAQANLLRARDEGAPPIARQLAMVDDIEVLDANRLRLSLNAPAPALLNNLARTAGMMISPGAFDSAAEMPIGTGPWTFNADESTPDAQYVFEAFADFWNPQQQGLARIELLILPDPAARVNALRSGEIQAASIDPPDAESLEAEGFALRTNEAILFGFHIFDREGTIVPEFADERVRQAISYALDRETFVDALLYGFAEARTQRFAPGQVGYADDLMDLSYDPERARELLAEAGVENLEFSVPDTGVGSSEMQAVAGQLSEVGITVNIETVPPGTLVQEASSGNWPIALAPINEPHVATFLANRVQTNGFMNPFRVTEADLEEMIQEARSLPADEAAPIWADVSRAVSERGIIVYLYSRSSLVAVAPEVQGAEVGYMQPDVLRLRGVTIEE